ncbi:restriction endonuclease [Sediminibacterium ginsengisoli]|uniref:Restriction endonuclease n=1 Tax=Sediminibacterium ginsengisoli TaxID=413434 RepID=A0A1T4NZJ7_9BACT|nr:restriction endonuclease [Sediminibacterium ginsengisoli]SJZ84609.1 Restriction endonuclease [Sediminibacterium ginsengisoli]
MNTTEKGDILEALTLLVERSVSHQPGTVFKKKHTIKDQHGINRVLDLFVTTQVNGKSIKYAFECKHHKKGIPMKDILDFHGMIENKGITGFFVTSGTFQSGAIKKAAALGITLLTLKKRAPTGNDMAGVHLFKKNYEITNVAFSGTSSHFDNETIQKLFSECKGCKKGIKNIFNKTVIPKLAGMIEQAVDRVSSDFTDVTKIASTFGKENARGFQFIAVHDNGCSITHQNTYPIYISHTVVDINVWHEKVHSQSLDFEHFLYSPVGDPGSGTMFSKSELVIKDKRVVICASRPESGAASQSIIMANEDHIQNAHPMTGVPLGTLHQFGLSDIFSSGDTKDSKCVD